MIAVLRSRGGTSLQTLARECGVSERTSRRDLIALEVAGFPIDTVGEWDAKLYRFPRGIPCPICGKAVTETSRPQRDRLEAQRMRGNFNAGRRPTLKKRLESIRRQNRALSSRDQAHRCAHCRGPLPAKAYTVFGEPGQYCSALCMPRGELA